MSAHIRRPEYPRRDVLQSPVWGRSRDAPRIPYVLCRHPLPQYNGESIERGFVRMDANFHKAVQLIGRIQNQGNIKGRSTPARILGSAVC